MEILKPYALSSGDTIGIFTPSGPAYQVNEGLFVNGVKNLEQLGYRVKLGSLTQKRQSQGYRSGTPRQRAQELMELIQDDQVQAVISTIGGSNSNSLIPYLDFDLIRQKRKILCGYSDVTSLHLSILKYAGLTTLYGPSVMTWFGEYPNGIQESVESFLKAVSDTTVYPRQIHPFEKWSNHARNWTNGEWKTVPRQWNENTGWKVLREGECQGEIVIANLNTLMSSAGTSYFPNLKGKILIIEEMSAPFSRVERSLTQLKLIGVFDELKALVMGKAEFPDPEGAPFSLDDLLLECVGQHHYPILSHFDCAHTVPMHTLGQACQIELKAHQTGVHFTLLDSFVHTKVQ